MPWWVWTVGIASLLYLWYWGWAYVLYLLGGI